MQKFLKAAGWTRQPSACVTASQRTWLTRPGALTQGLRALGPLHLRVLSEKVCRIKTLEARELGLAAGSAVWQREVCMAIDGIDCVVAHSVTPRLASLGNWQAVRRLHTRPLADILYHDRSIVRSSFDFTRLTRGMPLYLITQHLQPGSVCHARRSVFWRKQQPLLVAEAFLPAFWQRLSSISEHGCTRRH